MTDQERKAMEMALEWMEAIVNSNWRNWEELASPEEFERWVKSRANHSAVALRQALAQGKQEPVAWTLTEFLDKRETTTNAPLWFVDPVNSAWTPLYTAPPSKPWVSLTDEEKWSIFTSKDWTGKPLSLIDAVLTAYEEKNRD